MEFINNRETMKKKSWSWKKFLVVFLIGWIIIQVLFYFNREYNRKALQDSQRESLVAECREEGGSISQCGCIADWINQNYNEDIEKEYIETGKAPQDFHNKAVKECKNK
jgi:hypothetical protein